MEEHIYSDKEGIRILLELMVQKGIKRVVLSPGSRNAPLLISFTREKRIEHFVVLDERSAAFFALGLAQQSGAPVALVCTSGTALLNYAPAIAEAWYQRIPLIVISADRPAAWIDQDDSQTIRQEGILSKIVKGSWVLPVELRDEEEIWFANRIINDALNFAQKGRKAPVHLNIPLGEPLYGVRRYTGDKIRSIGFIKETQRLDNSVMDALAEQFSLSPKILILAGFMQPDEELNKTLQRLACRENVIVLTENISNLEHESFITTIDRVLSSIPNDLKADFAPDLLITFGGALISRQVKAFLRNNPPRQHWSIDNSDHPADTFKALTSQINLEAIDFFKQLSEQLEEKRGEAPGTAISNSSGYAGLWRKQDAWATERHQKYTDTATWSDLRAFALLMPALPSGSALQVSNGTPVRYAQLFKHPQVTRRDANRGTSGIEGATSVAVAASWLREGVTTLITGDMSFIYDSNALWNRYISPRLKIIVMKNGGGGIFRFIPGPSDLPELEECFETAQDVNVRGFADTHHFQFYEAASEEELKNVLPAFWKISDRPAILEIRTPRLDNGEVLKAYFKNLMLT